MRDSEELRELDWPVFAANVCIRGTGKRADGAGSLGQSVLIGEILVHTGDLLVADADGVVVIARADVERVVELGAKREAEERAFIERLKNGERTMDIYKLPAGN